MRVIYSSLLISLIVICHIQSQNWIPQGEGQLPFGYIVNGISVVEDSVIWISASLEQGLNYPIKIFRSIDAGETWESTDITQCQSCKSTHIEAIDKNIAWLAATDGIGFGKLYTTKDGGQTWLLKLEDPSAKGSITIFDELHLMCQFGAYFSWSDDGGETWETDVVSGDPSGYNPYLAGPVTVTGDTSWLGMVPTIYDYSISANLMRLTNYGRDIEFIPCEGLDSIYSIWLVSFSDHRNGVMAYTRWIYGYDYYGWWYFPSEDDKLAVTSDGGESWSNIPKPTANIKAILAIPDVPGAYVLADEFRVAWTRDHGDNWEQQLIPYRISEFDFSSSEVGWMAVNGTSITHPLVLKWNGDFVSDVRESPIIYEALPVFPNPTADMLYYSIDNDIAPHALILKDVTGKTILTETSLEGHIDIRHVPSGIYLLEMHSTDNIRFGKVIKTE